LAKPPKNVPVPIKVRTRRAYFDFAHGQLHVRTAFPGTGGFDELVTLFCLHSAQASSRTFARFLPEIADVRSAYAPDLPGCGESDPAPDAGITQAAAAVFDLALDLRLRQIDLLGFQSGAAVAMELAATQAQLVRRLVLIDLPAADRLSTVKQPALVLRTRLEAGDGLPRVHAALPHGKFVDIPEYAADLFEAAPITLAKDIGAYLASS
jgi:pimeloyl-ACP methyl ester carboxylesterase